MNAFDFAGPQDTVFRIHQDASGVIGCKLYPGALLLCSYLSHKPIPSKSLCLELGAGACGLPSLWLKHSGCDVITTEQECVLPLLEANMGRAKEGVVGGEHPTPGRLLCTPLTWGEEGGVGRLMNAMREKLGVERVALDYIVAADVVYHDPLIAPLLQTLVELTEGGPSEGDQGPPPPIIILSYVQRFKRAKRFFKLAAAYFDVKVVAGPPTGGGGGGEGEATTATVPGGGLCVDYDTLTWTLPKVLEHFPRGTSGVQQGGEGKEVQHIPLVHTHHASYKDFSELVIKAAAAGANGSGGACEAAESVKPSPPAATSSKHGIDSDSEDEWEASEAFAKNFASTVGGDDSSGSAQGEGPAARAARQLGLTLPPPSQAYIYMLTRKPPTKKGVVNKAVH